MKIKLKKWGCLKKFFNGSATKTRRFKKYVVILLPILYSLIDSYSDANYCFGISTGKGLFDIGGPSEDWLLFIGQKMMLAFLFIGKNKSVSRKKILKKIK